MDAWLGISLKYLTIASFSFLFVVHTLRAWAVGEILGEEFLPVAANLKMLAFAILPGALVRTGISLSVIHRKSAKSSG